jgi:HAD superfamily hydrolase (TIGR01509 family)
MLTDKQAVLFDLDGTLADSMWVWTDIDRTFFASRQIPVPDSLQKDIEGMSFTETAQYFIDTFHLPETLEELKQLWNHMAMERYATEVKLKPGALDFLYHLKRRGIRIGIATSNSRLLLDVFLHRNHLKGLFDSLTTSDEVKQGKPSPDVYLCAARKMQIKPDRCLVFEDLPNGILAGKNAGMEVCAVEDPYSADQKTVKQQIADYYIRDFLHMEQEN